MLFLALLPALTAVAIFAATCTMKSPRARAQKLGRQVLGLQLRGLPLGSDDETPRPPRVGPNFGGVA